MLCKTSSIPALRRDSARRGNRIGRTALDSIGSAPNPTPSVAGQQGDYGAAGTSRTCDIRLRKSALFHRPSPPADGLDLAELQRRIGAVGSRTPILKTFVLGPYYVALLASESSAANLARAPSGSLSPCDFLFARSGDDLATLPLLFAPSIAARSSAAIRMA